MAISNLFDIFGSLRTKRQNWTLLGILPWLTLAASLAVTHQLWASARRNSEQALQARFNNRVRNTIGDVSKRMNTYEQVMRGVDGFFSHAGVIERSEFHDYIANLKLKESYPGIQGIRFVPLVRKAEKDRHIATVHTQGLNVYTIWPDGQRDTYAPVTFIEPFDVRNQRVFGYDMLSDRDYPLPDEPAGIRRTAMEQARDSGNFTLSGKIKRMLFESDRDWQGGFIMFLPVYRHGASHGTTAERRASIIGWICSTFLANDLMSGILGDRGSEIDIEIYDGEEVSAKTMMYDPHPTLLHQSPRFRTTRQLKVANRTWTVAVHSLPGFEDLMDAEKPRIIAFYGISTSLFLALLIWVLASGRKRAMQASKAIEQEMSERRQAEQSLQEVEARYRYVFDNSKVGISLAGPDYKYLRLNRAFCEMTGYSEEELLARDFKEITHPDHIAPNLTLEKNFLRVKLITSIYRRNIFARTAAYCMGTLPFPRCVMKTESSCMR